MFIAPDFTSKVNNHFTISDKCVSSKYAASCFIELPYCPLENSLGKNSFLETRTIYGTYDSL